MFVSRTRRVCRLRVRRERVAPIRGQCRAISGIISRGFTPNPSRKQSFLHLPLQEIPWIS